jgi:hypothetical protein
MAAGRTKAQRLGEFQRRLAAAAPARSFDEAYGQIARIMNEVEDEFSEVPYNPSTAEEDGRLYPPLWDNIQPIPAQPDIKRLRSAGHVTLIAMNGAIAIDDVFSRTRVFSKAGADGREVDSQ